MKKRISSETNILQGGENEIVWLRKQYVEALLNKEKWLREYNHSD